MYDIGEVRPVRFIDILDIEKVMSDIGKKLKYSIKYDVDTTPHDFCTNVTKLNPSMAKSFSDRIDYLMIGGFFYYEDIGTVLSYLASYDHIPTGEYTVEGLHRYWRK